MKLTVVGSGSSGNCYLMDDGINVLIIEAGVHIKHIKQALEFDLSRVIGCICTHGHADHGGYAAQYAKAGIDICTSKGTIEELGLDGHRIHELELFKEIKLERQVEVPSFKVAAFDVEHDAQEPIGFLIRHEYMGTALFVTDTHYIKYKMTEKIDNLLIEANYSNDIVDEKVEGGSLHIKLADRIRRSHMSIENVEDFIKANNLDPRNVVLLHLSDSNSNSAEFKQQVESLVDGNVFIAEPGLIVNLDKYPF